MSMPWNPDDFRGEFDEELFLKRVTSSYGDITSSTASSSSSSSTSSSSPRKSLNAVTAFNTSKYELGFTNTIDELSTLDKTVTTSLCDLRATLCRQEIKHHQQLLEQQHVLTTLVEQFNALDKRLSSVAHTAVAIGDRLERVDECKRRCSRGHRLINVFLACNDEPGSLPSSLKPSKMSELTKAAHLVQALQKVAAELTIPNTHTACENISCAAGEIEMRLLKEFEESYQANHMQGMRMAAKPLQDFEGGHLTSRFIANASTSLRESALSLTSHMNSIEQYHSCLARFFSSIVNLCQNNYVLINQVFTSPEQTIRLLLERIFEDNISSFVDRGLNISPSSDDMFIGVLDITFSETRSLLRDLNDVLDNQLPKSLTQVIRRTLTTQCDGVFHRHREEFVIRQTRLLESTATKFVNESFIESDKVVSNIAANDKTVSPDLSADFFSRLMKSNPVEEVQTWLRSVLSHHVIKRLVHVYSAALTRCDKLCDPETLSSVVHSIFGTLMNNVGKPFFFRLMDATLGIIPEPDDKCEPVSFLLELVGLLDSEVQILDQYFVRDVLPRMEIDLNAQTLCVRDKQDIIGVVEYRVRSVLSGVMQHTLSVIQRILNREQRKTDFRPRDDGNVLPDTSNASRACVGVVHVVRNHTQSAIAHLAGLNLDNYLNLLGVRLYDVIIMHIKRFTISNAGALLLMRDIREYHDCVSELHAVALDELFDTLRHLVNVFAVPPESLGSLLSDDPALSPERIDPNEIESFVRLRADFKSARLARLF